MIQANEAIYSRKSNSLRVNSISHKFTLYIPKYVKSEQMH